VLDDSLFQKIPYKNTRRSSSSEEARMSVVRRAFIMSSVEQYLALIINVGVVATMARLLTPEDAGHAVTGLGIAAIALSLREFVTPEYLIQKKTIDDHDLRTSFTLLLGITALVAVLVASLSSSIARSYHSPQLRLFLFLIMLSAFAEVVSLPIVATLRRNMAFGILAKMRSLALLTSAVSTVILGLLGFGFISYAWGMLASAVALASLAAYINPSSARLLWQPSLKSWKTAASFGRFKGASQAIDRIYEALPQLILGKVISLSSVGLYSRANTVCGIPDRMIMSAFYATAFPALAATARESGNIKEAYLNTLSYLSAFYWPGVLLIALTADPIVNIVLGPQWHDAVYLVRILAVAAVFWVATIVVNPLLLALGHNREAFLSSLTCRCIAVVILCTASLHGVAAIALSQFIALPTQMVVSLYFARKHLLFTLAELSAALFPSIVLSAFALTGPVTLLAFERWNLQLSPPQFLLSLLLALAGWLLGLVASQHPVLAEVRIILRRLSQTAGRLRQRFPA
jgi:O-antigen/teichoic acid export membrane protein